MLGSCLLLPPSTTRIFLLDLRQFVRLRVHILAQGHDDLLDPGLAAICARYAKDRGAIQLHIVCGWFRPSRRRYGPFAYQTRCRQYYCDFHRLFGTACVAASPTVRLCAAAALIFGNHGVHAIVELAEDHLPAVVCSTLVTEISMVFEIMRLALSTTTIVPSSR